MTIRKTAALLAALLALALLAGCGGGPAPAAETQAPSSAEAREPSPAPDAEPPKQDSEVHVSNVDEFLAAIASDTVIVLEKGDYDFSTAETYGQAPRGAHYDWDASVEAGEFELIVSHVDRLTIRGEDPEETRIRVQPRNVNALLFDGCRELRVENLSIGHTEGGFCNGGVLRFERCRNTGVEDCALFGCGTVGVWASSCEELSVNRCRIYECSDAAVTVSGCRDVRVEACEIDGNGNNRGRGPADCLLRAADTDGFTVCRSDIHDNSSRTLLSCERTSRAFFLSNSVENNRMHDTVFELKRFPAVVDGCAFLGNVHYSWTNRYALDPVDPDGQALDGEALEQMTLHDCDPDMPFPELEAWNTLELAPGETVSVRTADELLRAIGPDRTIVLEAELFDLADADRCLGGTDCCAWEECYDGLQLVIHDVSGLTILGDPEHPASVTISAEPRYADVLCFRNCSGISLSGLTAGHAKEPGYCVGGVLSFENCSGVQVDACRLYGCGTIGVMAEGCADLTFAGTEIFECSVSAGEFVSTEGISFTGCLVRDIPSPHLNFRGCGDLSWNGEALSNGEFNIGPDGEPVPLT